MCVVAVKEWAKEAKEYVLRRIDSARFRRIMLDDLLAKKAIQGATARKKTYLTAAGDQLVWGAVLSEPDCEISQSGLTGEGEAVRLATSDAAADGGLAMPGQAKTRLGD